MLGVGDARGRVVIKRRRLLAAQGGDDAREDDRQAVTAGVNDARLAQRGQQLGAALDRVLARLDGAFERGGNRLVLLAWLGRRPKARTLRPVGEVGGDLVGHLASDRQDRALGGVAHGGVGTVGGVRERRADQRRIDQLSRPADELLGGAADQLREDHAGVAARAQERRTRDRLDDLLAPDLVDRALLVCALQAVELVQHRAQRERHVVARVPVGDGKHVEVVDLLTARFQMGERARNSSAEADQIGIRHGNRSISFAGPSPGDGQQSDGLELACRAAGQARQGSNPHPPRVACFARERLRTQYGAGQRPYRALVTLPAFRQRVQT